MIKTLRDLVTENRFEGYTITPNTWRLRSFEIEEALYGRDAGRHYREDPATILAREHELDLVEIATWDTSEDHGGLEILRFEGQPVAAVWKNSEHSEHVIRFLDKTAHARFRDAWEAILRKMSFGPTLAEEGFLDMPVAAPGEPAYHLNTYDSDLPIISSHGMSRWLSDMGGVEGVTNRPVLCQALRSLDAEIDDRKATRDRLYAAVANSGEHVDGEVMSEFEAQLDDLRQTKKLMLERIAVLDETC